MRKRILFVDDEPQVLQGLRRMLHGQTREWELHFAASGAEALELMAAMSMVVIVSDMRMSGMDGVHLLGEVKRLYPETARVAFHHCSRCSMTDHFTPLTALHARRRYKQHNPKA